MVHFYRYDTPGTIPVQSSSLPSFAGFTAASIDLYAPDGTIESLPAALDGDTLTVTLPLLDQAGVYVVQGSVTGPGVSRALDPARIPVEEVGGLGDWHTIDSARRDWDGAPQDDARLFDLLQNARIQCEAYAPLLVAPAPVPTTYRHAQLLQARNLWNASRMDAGSQQMNSDGFQVTVFPLDWTVRALLRPIQGRPVVA